MYHTYETMAIARMRVFKKIQKELEKFSPPINPMDVLNQTQNVLGNTEIFACEKVLEKIQADLERQINERKAELEIIQSELKTHQNCLGQRVYNEKRLSGKSVVERFEEVITTDFSVVTPTIYKRRGRPAGSKNKVKS